MEKDIVEAIKRDCADMQMMVNKDYSELEELKNNPAVQRYLYLEKLKDERSLVERKERAITDEIIEKYGAGAIKETNNIWCFLYEIPGKRINKYFYFVYADFFNDNDTVALYCDIENSSRQVAIISNRKDEFEATHLVVYGNRDIYDGKGRYYNTRYQFFDDCIKYGQIEAVQKVLSRR